MESIQFFYFPFIIDQDTQKVIPQFDQDCLLHAAGMGNDFRLTIHGPANLLDIHQVATIMETWLKVDYLNWEFIESDTFNSEVIGVLHILEKGRSMVENELHKTINISKQLFDDWLSLIVDIGLLPDNLVTKLKSYDIKSDILPNLLSLSDSINLQENHNRKDFNDFIESFERELKWIDWKLRSSLLDLIEDNNFISVRQVSIIIEVSYLFTWFLNGLSSSDYKEFINRTKEFHASLDHSVNILNTNLSFLMRDVG